MEQIIKIAGTIVVYSAVILGLLYGLYYISIGLVNIIGDFYKPLWDVIDYKINKKDFQEWMKDNPNGLPSYRKFKKNDIVRLNTTDLYLKMCIWDAFLTADRQGEQWNDTDTAGLVLDKIKSGNIVYCGKDNVHGIYSMKDVDQEKHSKHIINKGLF